MTDGWTQNCGANTCIQWQQIADRIQLRVSGQPDAVIEPSAAELAAFLADPPKLQPTQEGEPR